VQDEQNRFGNPFVDKLISRSGINKISPEGFFGLYDKEGKKKEILQGNLKSGKSQENKSQLARIIGYLKRPLPEKKEE